MKGLTMRKKILVVGGLGFIGHHVAGELHALGHDVLTVDLETDYDFYDPIRHQKMIKLRRSRTADVPTVRQDIRDSVALGKIMDEFEPHTVIHLANVPIAGVVLRYPVKGADQIVTGTMSVLESARSTGVKRFTYISSSMVYGDWQTEAPDETHPCEPREPYGAMKLACEQQVRLYTLKYGLEHVIIRPTAVYGPTGNEAFVLTKFVDAAIRSATISIHGDQTKLDFSFVEDTAHGIVLAALSKNSGNETFNIARGSARLLTDAAEILRKISPNTTVEIQPRDAWYPKRGQLCIDKAASTLGYIPKFDIEEGLRVFFEFNRSHLFSPPRSGVHRARNPVPEGNQRDHPQRHSGRWSPDRVLRTPAS